MSLLENRSIRTSAAFLCTAALLLTAVATPAQAQEPEGCPVRYGVEVGSKPFLAAAGGVAVVTEAPVTERVRGAAALDLWTVSAAGGTGSGTTRRMTEAVVGLRAEASMPGAFTGIGLGVHAVTAAWTDGTFRAGSPFGAGFLSAEIFHPISLLTAPTELTILPGLSAYFSLGPGGISWVPDILPALRLRAVW
ncbi:MAG: hypothetical protein ACLFO1_02140 [Spirochaetaceae bacterium]